MPIVALWLAAVAAAPPLPAEVTSVIDRRVGCGHWGGEDPYDPARGAEIAAAMRQLRCASLAADEARLRRRYARQPAVIAALDAAQDE